MSVLGSVTLEGFSSLDHSMDLQSQSPRRSTGVPTDISTNLISVTLCLPHSNPHPVPPFPNNSWGCLSPAGAHSKPPWQECPCLSWVRLCQERAASITQENLSLKTLPWSWSCCQEQDSSDPNKLETWQKENRHIITKTAK